MAGHCEINIQHRNNLKHNVQSSMSRCFTANTARNMKLMESLQLTRIHNRNSWNERTVYTSRRNTSCPLSSPIEADLQGIITHYCSVWFYDCLTNSTSFSLNIEILLRQISLKQLIRLQLKYICSQESLGFSLTWWNTEYSLIIVLCSLFWKMIKFL